jgi:hypothetical protein
MTDKLHPSRVQEDQDVEMKPIVVGPPPYSSPDPATEGNQMIPLDQGTSGEHGDASDFDPEDANASEWVDAVNSASSQEELDDLKNQYKESGANYKTVKDAFKAHKGFE